jgi:hypothetical protein
MSDSPKQITIRGPSPELSRRLKALAQSRGESLNATILAVLSEAVGIEGRRRQLARYATWTESDVEEFERALREQRRIDEELWT